MMNRMIPALIAAMFGRVSVSTELEDVPQDLLIDVFKRIPMDEWHLLSDITDKGVAHEQLRMALSDACKHEFPGYQLLFAQCGRRLFPESYHPTLSLVLEPGYASVIGEPKPELFPARYTGEVIFTPLLDDVAKKFAHLSKTEESIQIYNFKEPDITKDSWSVATFEGGKFMANRERFSDENHFVLIQEMKPDGTMEPKVRIPVYPLDTYAFRKGDSFKSLELVVLRGSKLRCYDAMNGFEKGSPLPIRLLTNSQAPTFSSDGKMLRFEKWSECKCIDNEFTELIMRDTRNGQAVLEERLDGRRISSDVSLNGAYIALDHPRGPMKNWSMFDLKKRVWWEIPESVDAFEIEWISDDLFGVVSGDKYQVRSAAQYGRLISRNGRAKMNCEFIQCGVPLPFDSFDISKSVDICNGVTSDSFGDRAFKMDWVTV